MRFIHALLVLALAVLCAYGASWLWPVSAYSSSWVGYLIAGLLGFIALRLGVKALILLFEHQHQSHMAFHADNPNVCLNGARFMTEAEMESAGLFDPNNGPPFGEWHGRTLHYRFTHSLAIAPAGSGKTTCLTIPALCHGYWLQRENCAASTICVDLKRELRPMTWHLRKYQHGHRIIVIDPSHPDSDCYNPLDLVRDAYEGRIPKAKAKTYGMMLALILEPEPEGDEKNRFFRNGSRQIIMVVIHMVCIYSPEKANLIEVRRIILDPNTLISMLSEAEKSDALDGDLALMAKDVLYQKKHLDEFRTGASQALEPYSPAGELTHVVASSSFRWADLKAERITVYICADLAEQDAFRKFLQLYTECAMTEILQAPGNNPVHVLLDEATNFAFDISKKLTALRGVGARVQVIAQEYEEMLRVFGKHSGPTIFNETDLKQFFSISDIELAKKLSVIMGDRYEVQHNFNRGSTPWDEIQRSTSAQKVPLMSPDAIMRMPPDDQLVQIRGLPHFIYCRKLRYDWVSPWLEWLDDNPLEGGKLPGPPYIHLHYTRHGVR